MKLLRFGEAAGAVKIGVEQSDGSRYDVSAFGGDYDEAFLGSNGPERLRDWLAGNLESCPSLPDNVRLAAPIARPSKIVCVGLNYAKHAEEAGATPPTEPVLFLKATSAICGPYDDVAIPSGSEKTDWEVELAVVIGRRAKNVAEADALDYVAGYCVHNDVSERAHQLERGGQWVKGKSHDTFAPLGPYLVTADEVPDPNKLDLWLELNGKRVQHSNTSDFIFSVQECISYISRFMTLLPGDVISTGTPSGVGLGLGYYLKSGDVMELSVAGLGVARQRAV